jgi:hypothetical protein
LESETNQWQHAPLLTFFLSSPIGLFRFPDYLHGRIIPLCYDNSYKTTEYYDAPKRHNALLDAYVPV